MGHKVSPVFWFRGMQRFCVLVAASKKLSWSVENENPELKNKSDSAWKSEYGVEISKRLAVPENLGCVALLACQNKRERKKRIGMWWEMG